MNDLEKHTPGPWKVGVDRNRVYYEVRGPDECFISDASGIENARLIAAAPELLAVVQLVTESGLVPEWSGLGKAARAAIAKAKGGS